MLQKVKITVNTELSMSIVDVILVLAMWLSRLWGRMGVSADDDDDDDDDQHESGLPPEALLLPEEESLRPCRWRRGKVTRVVEDRYCILDGEAYWQMEGQQQWRPQVGDHVSYKMQQRGNGKMQEQEQEEDCLTWKVVEVNKEQEGGQDSDNNEKAWAAQCSALICFFRLARGPEHQRLLLATSASL